MQRSNPSSTQAISTGYIASEIFSRDREASVLGKTSRGIFLKTSSKWLTFVTIERFRSPLTINLNGTRSSLQDVESGMPVQVSSGLLYFPGAGTMISIQGSQIWHPPPPLATPIPEKERLARLTDFASEVRDVKPGVGLDQLLPNLLNLSGAHPASIQGLYPFQADLSVIRQHLSNKEPIPLAKMLCRFLGAGPGLTPSGDDFVAGLLLALNRWRDALWPGEDILYINHHVVEAAYKKTTTLSANLIELAVLGQGDERLIKTVDFLMSGMTQESEVAANLLGWGHSSGVAAFVGMATALSA